MLTPFLPLLALAAPALAASGDCHPLRLGVAPTPTPNTSEAFASSNYYSNAANLTAHSANYERFMVGSNAALHDDEAYLTFKELSSYNADECAKECDELRGCTSCKLCSTFVYLPYLYACYTGLSDADSFQVNIYFQRHPSLAPGPVCPNPEANVVVRCALFGAPMSVAQATNHGQLRGPADREGEEFEVLVAGSNGEVLPAIRFMLYFMIIWC